MKNLLLAITIVLTATSAQASNVKFETTDNSPASNLCVIAVEQGIEAAGKAAKALGSTAKHFKCNGMSVKRFVKTYEVKPVETVESFKAVSFVAANDNNESALCVQAATQGLGSLSIAEKRTVICNGRSIRKFAALYSAK